nr:S8 family serine peptidase [Patulibacter sp. SYSU D01012]
MTQLVHDLAPGAGLSFATAFGGQQAFADNIRRLRAAGADVLTDDVGYYDEPIFQPGPIDVAIADVRRDGASYYSSAGNAHATDAAGHAIGSWETPALRPVTTDVPAPPTTEGPEGVLPTPGDAAAYEDFDPAPDAADTGLGITVPAGGRLLLDLQWAEPWDGVRTDLDLYLHDGTGRVLAKSTEPNAAPLEDGGQRPVEIVSWKNAATTAQTVQASIVRAGTGAARTPRAKVLIAGDVTAVEHAATSSDTFGPTVFGHSGGEDTVSVGAINASAPQAPAAYSSRGPVTHVFGPVRPDGRPADALPAPRRLSKPDVAATDCTKTTFFGSRNTFCGTSAAAPHAAAVDALARQAAPWATDDQIVAAVVGSGVALPTFGPLDAGTGRIDALAVVRAARAVPRPAAPATAAPAPVSPAPPAPAPAAPAAPSVPVLRDTVRPVVRLTSGPRPRTRARRARFVVRTEKGATLRCRVDRGRWRACRSPFVVTARVGLHVVRVQATDAAGNRSRVAVRRWRVLRGR